MKNTTQMDSKEHIVMLPFMAQGHLIPFLALARQIHQKTGFTITIANTPKNVQYLRNTISNNSNSSDSHICLAELPFNSSDHGLPPNAENTEILTAHQIMNLCHASVGLEIPFHRLLTDITEEEGKPPLCVISDIILGWAIQVAESVRSVGVCFATGGAYGTAAYVSIWQNLPHRSTESDEFGLPGFPDTVRLHRSQLHQFLKAADGTDNWSKFFQPQISLSLNSHGCLCNTAEEIEPLGLEVLRNYTKLPVWTVGPLLPPYMFNHSSDRRIFAQRAGKEPGVTPEKCLEFLDSHPPGSVLYISFGSQNTISPSQMFEVSLGLEESGKPFIWAIRPPIGFDTKGEFKAEWLPEGFEERITKSGQGLLVHNWAPQLEILSHISTGAFLSHCGWNSVLESLSQGVPIIGWPMAAEQAYNSKMMMEDIGVSVELTRGAQSTIVGKDVKKVMALFMDKNGGGEEMRKKAIQIGEKIRTAVKEEGGQKGSSVKAMDDFISFILSKRRQSCDKIEAME